MSFWSLAVAFQSILFSSSPGWYSLVSMYSSPGPLIFVGLVPSPGVGVVVDARYSSAAIIAATTLG